MKTCVLTQRNNISGLACVCVCVCACACVRVRKKTEPKGAGILG